MVRLTIVSGHFFKVAIALGGLSLIEEWHDEMQAMVLQPFLEGGAQFLCQHGTPSTHSCISMQLVLEWR